MGQYLDYENCKCRKKLIDQLVEECSGNTESKWNYLQWYFEWLWKNIQFLYNIHSIISHIRSSSAAGRTDNALPTP